MSNGYKVCLHCYESLPLIDFGKSRTNLDGLRGMCKKCDSQRKVVKTILENAEKHPERHKFCNDCDRIFNAVKSRYLYKKGELLKVCKFCGSKNIEAY